MSDGKLLDTTEKPQDDRLFTVSQPGLESRYTCKGETEERVITGHLIDGGGVFWQFTRGGQTLPLRLSDEGMQRMVSLWHDLTWGKCE